MERCGLESRTNFFSFKKSAKTSADWIRVRIRFENIRYIPLHVSSTVVLIIRRSKLYYTASGIITPVGGHPVHSLLSTCARDSHLQV